MTTQTLSTMKYIIISAICGILLGFVVGGGVTYQYLTEDHFKVYKTNIGLMVFVKDRIYNLSELKSLD
jgi:hypothetical protein